MRTGSFDYTIEGLGTVASAVDLMADVPRLVTMHPLAVSTAAVAPGPGVLRSTAVTSRLKFFGPVGMHITYRADLVLRGEDEVVTVAHQQPRTTLRSHVRVVEAGEGRVRIDVGITFESPGLLFSYGFGKARFAHEHMRAEITKYLNA
ncbi:SRPBCC family protein [Lentzea sp. JNUCC 0626]|uniref:SRPBCC family protein n=1 Tax=Lentzea sp. JNUCC 0626 TaxID=3367513 RepID=UPI0037499A86